MSKPVVERPPALVLPDDLQSVMPFMDVVNVTDEKGRYLHWSQYKWRVPKADQVCMWKAVKFKRLLVSKTIRLFDEKSKQFGFCIPSSLESDLYQLVKIAGGQLSTPDGSNPANTLQDRFLVSSLIMEEAITSAQLEGAATTREVAKKMLEDEREPINEDERMILNNYLLMKHAEKHCDDELTVDLILEFHRIATAGTTENGVVPGELRQDNSIYVDDGQGGIAHQPPSHELLHDRLLTLCRFANADHSGAAGINFINPIIKAIILHFMIGYDHPFRDGNGRTARALFYWFMLKSKYNLFKYLSISKVIKENAKEYGRAFLYTETDNNDLTYFFYNQVGTIMAALDELRNYLAQKAKEYENVTAVLDNTKWGSTLNFTQKDLIKKAFKEPGRTFNVKSVSNAYCISDGTARSYLNKLIELKLFIKGMEGKTAIYIAPSDISQRIGGKK